MSYFLVDIISSFEALLLGRALKHSVHILRSFHFSKLDTHDSLNNSSMETMAKLFSGFPNPYLSMKFLIRKFPLRFKFQLAMKGNVRNKLSFLNMFPLKQMIVWF